MIRTLYMGNGGVGVSVGVSGIVSRNSETGTVWACKVESVVAYLTAVDTFDRAITDAVFLVVVCTAAVGGVIITWVSTAT